MDDSAGHFDDMATMEPSGFAEPDQSGAKDRNDIGWTSATEFCDSAESNARSARSLFERSFCTRYLQHAKPFVCGPSADDAKLTLCETRLVLWLDADNGLPLLVIRLIPGRGG